MLCYINLESLKTWIVFDIFWQIIEIVNFTWLGTIGCWFRYQSPRPLIPFQCSRYNFFYITNQNFGDILLLSDRNSLNCCLKSNEIEAYRYQGTNFLFQCNNDPIEPITKLGVKSQLFIGYTRVDQAEDFSQNTGRCFLLYNWVVRDGCHRCDWYITHSYCIVYFAFNKLTECLQRYGKWSIEFWLIEQWGPVSACCQRNPHRSSSVPQYQRFDVFWYPTLIIDLFVDVSQWRIVIKIPSTEEFHDDCYFPGMATVADSFIGLSHSKEACFLLFFSYFLSFLFYFILIFLYARIDWIGIKELLSVPSNASICSLLLPLFSSYNLWKI